MQQRLVGLTRTARWTSLIAMLLVVAACGGGQPAAEAPAPAREATTGATADQPTAGENPTAETEQAEPTASAGEANGFEEVMAAIEGLEGQQRLDELARLAQQEGTVQIYSTMNSMPRIAEAFTAEYGVPVEAYDAGSGDIRNRVLEEAQAGNVIADVVENNGPEMFTLNQEGVLVPYDSVHEDKLIDGAKQDGWIAVRVNYFATSWNTNLVAPEEIPQRYQDLADPRWQGRMGMEVSDADWYWALSNYLRDDEGMTAEEVQELFRQMAANSAILDGHTTARQLLIAGEYALLASDLRHSAQGDIAKGAPIAWEPPIQPQFGRANGAALVRNAPHPASAILLLEFLLGETAQGILAEDHYNPVDAELAARGGDYDTRLIDIPAYMAERTQAEQEYAAITSGAPG